MVSRTLLLLVATLPMSTYVTLTQQECQPPTVEYGETQFSMVIEDCEITRNGNYVIDDVSVVAIATSAGADQVSFFLPGSCMDGAQFDTEVSGTHVIVGAGVGCATVSSPTGYPGDVTELEHLEFDGFDVEGEDMTVDYIEGMINVRWKIPFPTPIGGYVMEEVSCPERPFVGFAQIDETLPTPAVPPQG